MLFVFLGLGAQPNISTLSALVFLLLQKFELTLLVRYCCVIRTLSSNFNPSCYLQLWLGSVHQSYTAGASLGEELIGLSSLGAGDFILRRLMAFKFCHTASYGWAMMTKIVDQLELCSCPNLMTLTQPWLELLRFVRSTWQRSNYVTSNWQEVPNGFFPKRCTYCLIL